MHAKPDHKYSFIPFVFMLLPFFSQLRLTVHPIRKRRRYFLIGEASNIKNDDLFLLLFHSEMRYSKMRWSSKAKVLPAVFMWCFRRDEKQEKLLRIPKAWSHRSNWFDWGNWSINRIRTFVRRCLRGSFLDGDVNAIVNCPTEGLTSHGWDRMYIDYIIQNCFPIISLVTTI